MAIFRARARAVDMLGRQQISGIPTAISELFKNAHDAYADRAEVDYYESDGLFVLRDDGVGMSRQDFEDRWLTLGTDSKLNDALGIRPPPRDPSKAVRPILGEKGIGRLASAAIGSQALILTRAKTPNGVDELVAAFVNWSVFRLAGLNLDQVEVPIRTFPGGQLPSRTDVSELVDLSRQAVIRATAGKTSDLTRSVLDQLDAFEVDPRELDSVLGAPSLAGANAHGTHFYIRPADESLQIALETPDDEFAAAPLFKMLVGFTNTMTPKHKQPVIRVAFRDHPTNDTFDDIIEDSVFFTPAEFENADHHIAGEFDDFGQFAGTVAVYGEKTQSHVVPWRGAAGRATLCGPFKINVAVVQGIARESTLPAEDWARLIAKLNRIGGLYIYKDGVRVLPYGNTDYDFLDIERNRTKSASYYYFSFRRVFGVIETTAQQNRELQEKAGREGFRENRAYAQFREILKNFFVQIAADFFREGGASAARFHERRAELDRLERARRRREKLVAARRKQLSDTLEQRFADVGASVPLTESTKILAVLANDMSAAKSANDPDQAARLVLQGERRAQESLRALRDRFRVIPPRGVGLTIRLRRELDAYKVQAETIDLDIFNPTAEDIERRVREGSLAASAAVDRRIRFDTALDELGSSAKRATQSETKRAQVAAQEVKDQVSALANAALQDVDRAVAEVSVRAQRLDISTMSDSAFVASRRELEAAIETVLEEKRETLSRILARLRGVQSEMSQAAIAVTDEALDDTTDTDGVQALEEEVLALRERAESDIELAQLGMAIQIISHEFDTTIKGVRRNIRELRAWADANTQIKSLYDSISRNFQHLDGYLTLFTPLQRRLYRSATDIRGAEIFRFLQELFGDRINRHGVTLEATPEFTRFVFRGFPSAFYPVFVNLLDNALFWLRGSTEPAIVRLDAEGKSMYVSNTGSELQPRDGEQIFDLGFTRKPGGRGMGLTISRDALKSADYQLTLVHARPGMRVSFAISPVEGSESPEDGRLDFSPSSRIGDS
jgi:hypothetical protein